MITVGFEHYQSAERSFIEAVHDPHGRLSRCLTAVEAAARCRQGRLALAIGSTETSDLNGISAAGADSLARRFTPALDAEALLLGYPLSAPAIPVSPEGIVSPVVASRAMTRLLNCSVEVFDCGAFEPPRAPCWQVGNGPARCIDSGASLDVRTVEHLYQQGKRAGEFLAQSLCYLVIGECIPGGTTTACGLLTALGCDAARLVSSSMLKHDGEKRSRLVQAGMQRAALDAAAIARAPLLAVAAVGDPMQPFVAGAALAASSRIPVVLGGGTQMLAVYALMRALVGEAELRRRSIAVITTKWVARDQFAGAAQLACLVDAPLAAAHPDFTRSRHCGLRAYELGNVKEGVGLGAMLALASMAGYDAQAIMRAVDDEYDLMVTARRD